VRVSLGGLKGELVIDEQDQMPFVVHVKGFQRTLQYNPVDLGRITLCPCKFLLQIVVVVRHGHGLLECMDQFDR